MNELHLPWLELAILIPAFACLLVWRVTEGSQKRQVSLWASGLTLLVSTAGWIDFQTLFTYQARDYYDAIHMLIGIDELVMDKLNGPLLPLTALLFFLTQLATPRVKNGKFSYGLSLASLAITLAILSCNERWLLVLLLGIHTIPVWLELRDLRQSTRVFEFHMAIFFICLVIGNVIYETTSSPRWHGVAISLWAIAVLIRSGCCPLHCWITDLFERATWGTSLLFVTPLIGAYAGMRLILPVAPDWALQNVAILSLTTAIYASCMAIVQTNTRRFFCYLFLSHSSLVLAGLEAATPIGLAGALSVWLSVALSLTGMGLVLRCVEARTGPISLTRFHGFYNHLPNLAGFFILTGLSCVGFPCTIGFVASELLVEAAIAISPWVGCVVVVSTALNGIAFLRAYFRIFTGTVDQTSISLQAMTAEKIAIFTLTLLLVGVGLVPQPGVGSRFDAAVELLNHRDGYVPPAPMPPHSH